MAGGRWRQRRRERGATQNDVVVGALMCIVILALVVLVGPAVLGPWHSRTPAYRSGCKNNLKQIGIACVCYSANNGDFWPAASNVGGDIDRNPRQSLALLYPDYLDDVTVFRCPSTEDKPELRVIGSPESGRRRWGSVESHQGLSYGYDQFIHFHDVTPSTATVADMDGSSFENPPSVTSNHVNGQNVGFFDAHVSWKISNFASNDPLDNIYTAEPGWGADTDVALKRTFWDGEGARP